MPGKHHGESFASRHRYPLVLAVVLLCIAVAGVATAVHNRREPGTPLIISPALPPLSSSSASAVPVADPPSPSVSPSLSPSASRSPSPARSPSRPAGPSPSATAGSFTARYTVTKQHKSSFQAAISVTNQGRAAASWTLVVTHDPDDGVRLKGSVGGRVTGSGDTITFRGGALSPGDSVAFGYQASKKTRDDVRPTSCRVDGVECRVTVER